MSFLMVFVLTLLTWNVSADKFQGLWNGKGRALTQSRKQNCHDVEMRFAIQADTFILRGGHYNCETISAEYPYYRFQIKGQDLYDGDRHVGKYLKDRVVIFSKSDGFELSLVIKNEELYFLESWIDGEDFFQVKAILSKNE